MRLHGLGLSEGVVHARVFIIERDRRDALPVYRIAEEEVEAEVARLHRALAATADELAGLVVQVTERIGAAQANIFVAQKMMVEDPVLRAEMETNIRNAHLNAEAAADKTLDGYEALLKEVDDDYLSERASDIGEIRRRLLMNIASHRAGEAAAARPMFAFEEPRIVVAEELSPGETVALDAANTAGFLTERGGPASHAAILARALGIPAVSGIPRIHRTLSHGQQILLNGTTGEVILWPSESTLKLYPAARRAGVARLHRVAPIPAVRVLANISLSHETAIARQADAEGIGLYRTEYEFLAANRLLTEDEQFAAYHRVVEAMRPLPVHVRLLDFGADKDAPFLQIPKEENPCLGFRGARLLMGRPELLVTQARALARASRSSPIHLIYPMIIDLDQFLRLREIVIQNTADIEGAQLHHGVMLEVPSACLQARELLDIAEFASIGSNDLIQYLFAVDRANDLVAQDYRPDKPAFWNLLADLAQAAREKNKPLSLCGEIGGQPEHLPKLLDLGIRTISVSPRLIGLARMTARRHLGS